MKIHTTILQPKAQIARKIARLKKKCKKGERFEHTFETGANVQENSWLFKLILVRVLMSYEEKHVC
jgi:hypothetical protein